MFDNICFFYFLFRLNRALCASRNRDLNQYIELVNTAEKIEYDKPNSVKASNSAVDKMYLLVRSASNAELESLFELLEHSLAKKWLAHQLIECH